MWQSFNIDQVVRKLRTNMGVGLSSEEVENRNLDLVDTVTQGAMENFQKIQDVIAHSMDVEIEEMQKQMVYSLFMIQKQ